MYAPLLKEYFLRAPEYYGSSQYAFVSLWLARSSKCRLAEPLSFSGCHAQVNPWSHTLKCTAVGPGRASPCLVWARSRGRPIPGRLHPGHSPLSSPQTGAIKFSPHYLRQSHHRLVLAGEGKGKKGVGGGSHQTLSLCECVFYYNLGKGVGGVFVRKIRQVHFTMLTPLPTRLRPNCSTLQLT